MWQGVVYSAYAPIGSIEASDCRVVRTYPLHDDLIDQFTQWKTDNDQIQNEFDQISRFAAILFTKVHNNQNLKELLGTAVSGMLQPVLDDFGKHQPELSAGEILSISALYDEYLTKIQNRQIDNLIAATLYGD